MKRNAFITGSGGGLGVAVVERFLTAGWNVTAPRRADVDLNDPEAVRRAIEAAAPLHALVNLAGGFAAGEPVAETPVETFEASLRLNLRTTYVVCHAAIPHARRRRRDRLHLLGDRARAVRGLGGLRGLEGGRHGAGKGDRQGGHALQRARALADRHAREPRVDAGVLVGEVGAAGADRGGRAVARRRRSRRRSMGPRCRSERQLRLGRGRVRTAPAPTNVTSSVAYRPRDDTRGRSRPNPAPTQPPLKFAR